MQIKWVRERRFGLSNQKQTKNLPPISDMVNNAIKSLKKRGGSRD